MAANPELALQLGSRRLPVEPGWHFGSRYPGDPDRVAVYDFLPDVLLRSVVNLREFTGMLAFDKWVGNADGRQSVFFRSRIREWTAARSSTRPGFLAWMIDQGFAFNGPYWDFPDAPLQGIYHRPLVYESVRSLDDFEPWLERMMHFPETVVDEAYRQVPLEWLEGEEDAFEAVAGEPPAPPPAFARPFARLPAARPAMFPNWT